MWHQADCLQVTSEVKERNRLFRALNEIKDVALLNCNKNAPIEINEQFELIIQKCEDALKPMPAISKMNLRKIKNLIGK